MPVGAPAHFSAIICDVVDDICHERVTGRGRTVQWPATYPDPNLLDFYLWVKIKQSVYVADINNVETLHLRLMLDCETIRHRP